MSSNLLKDKVKPMALREKIINDLRYAFVTD